MSSSQNSDATTPSPPTLEELTTRSAAALLLPWVVGLTSDHPTAAAAAASINREVVVFVHQPTRSVALMEGSSDIDSFLSELISSKEGPPPASKSSIDTLPRVNLSPDEGFECPICLDDHGEGSRGGDDDGVEVKEMPCKHRFHADCIDKWLGMRGTCPVCRFGMPVEEKKVDEMSGWRIHVFFARGRGSSESGRDSPSGSGDEERERDDDEEEEEEVGHGSDSDDDDEDSQAREMETDD